MLPSSDNPDRLRWRLAIVLFLAQSLFSAAIIAAFTLTPIIAADLSGTARAAGVPNTVGLLGRALFAYPAGWLMDRAGRRFGLTLGYLAAMAGAAVSIWAIGRGAYSLFVLGALLMGIARSSAEQSRYVAAEVFPRARRARIIGFIVTAGAVGAIGGPALVDPSGQWAEAQGWGSYSGPFAAAGLMMFLAAICVFLFLRPDPRQMIVDDQADGALAPGAIAAAPASAAPPARSVQAIMRQPIALLALLAMSIGYLVMVMLMVITPLHMADHDHTTRSVSLVIMAHTLGMFGFAWLTGWLIDLAGRRPTILLGAAILILACILAPVARGLPGLSLALFLLGLGWNLCFVAGSSLFQNSLALHERGRGQGASEALIAVSSGLASLGSGYVFDYGGYLLAAAVGLGGAVVLVAGVMWLAPPWRPLPDAPHPVP